MIPCLKNTKLNGGVMTLGEIREFLGFRYSSEVADLIKRHPHTVYNWEKKGVPYAWQKHFKSLSKGKLQVSTKEKTPAGQS